MAHQVCPNRTVVRRPLLWQGRNYRTPPKQPAPCPRRGLCSGSKASWLLRAILLVSTLGRTSNQGCLLPRRAHALDGAGQQTTARGHRGLLPAVALRLVLVTQASTPSCHPQQPLCVAVRATHPVRSTGKGRRAESRSVSGPGPESLAAAPWPRRVRPVPSAGPGATIHHRVPTGKSSFLLFTKFSCCFLLFSSCFLVVFDTKKTRTDALNLQPRILSSA